MIIDIHGHYTTAPAQLDTWRQAQIAAAGRPFNEPLNMSDDEIRETIEKGQLKLQKERGTDVTLFSPRASTMSHHEGDERTSQQWSQVSNDLIARVCRLFPNDFVGVCMLPQHPGAPPANCIPELERSIQELGFVGCNLSPDPSDGHWTEPPLTDKWWYPLYERITELDVPIMVHVSGSCNPAFHATGAHYMNCDTTAFMQLLQGNLFKDFPTLRIIVPHGGGAVPYHWGRYRGLADMLKQPPLSEHLMHNVFFDTCVYGQIGMETLLRTIDLSNILFASEMIGAVRGIDPETGNFFDDTKRYIDKIDWLSEADRSQLYEGNALKVYPRLAKRLAASGS
jgi:4-oxalmesaconate hydratase